MRDKQFIQAVVRWILTEELDDALSFEVANLTPEDITSIIKQNIGPGHICPGCGQGTKTLLCENCTTVSAFRRRLLRGIVDRGDCGI